MSCAVLKALGFCVHDATECKAVIIFIILAHTKNFFVRVLSARAFVAIRVLQHILVIFIFFIVILVPLAESVQEILHKYVIFVLALEVRLFPLLAVLSQWLALYLVNQFELTLSVLGPFRYTLDKAGYFFYAFGHLNHFVSDFSHKNEKTLGDP